VRFAPGCYGDGDAMLGFPRLVDLGICAFVDLLPI
jgi:hypothetical protein